MHNSLTLKRQGYLLTNKYIHYLCSKFKVNTKKLRLVFALTSAAVVGSFCRFCFYTVLSSYAIRFYV